MKEKYTYLFEDSEYSGIPLRLSDWAYEKPHCMGEQNPTKEYNMPIIIDMSDEKIEFNSRIIIIDLLT